MNTDELKNECHKIICKRKRGRKRKIEEIKEIKEENEELIKPKFKVSLDFINTIIYI